MSNEIKVILDLTPLIKSLNDLNNLKKPIQNSIERLAMASYEKAISMVNQKLKHNDYEHKIYLQNLHWEKNSSGGFDKYLIILEEPALWIEDGKPEQDMRKTHLKGRKYVRIPFHHKSKHSATMPQKQQDILKEIKKALKDNKIPLTATIKDNNGKPILSTKNQPRAAAMIKNVESKIKGSISGKSILNNLNVYQSERTTRSGSKAIDRTYMTYRTLSEKSKASWKIPAKPGQNIFDALYNWIETNYRNLLDKELQNVNLVSS